MRNRVHIARGSAWIAMALLAACAHAPAFRAERPPELDVDDKAIAIIGDLQQSSLLARLVRHRENNAEAQQRLITDLRGHIDEFDALVIVGDLVFAARSARHWAHFDSLVAPFAERMPVLPAIGNHDYPCYFVELCRTSVMAKGMHERFPWLVPGTGYAVPSGDLLMLFLDSESHLKAQGAWLGDELDAAVGTYRAALVFFHRPPYTNSIDRGAEGNPDVQAYVVPRLEAARLPVVVFNGHVHGFEYLIRDGVRYVTTAGGGGPRGPIAAERPFDRYRGPNCTRERDGATLRPYNYLLLHEATDRLTIDVRGFCRGDEAVRRLDTIEVPL
jgi:Icc-related predicted phosphoesterase